MLLVAVNAALTPYVGRLDSRAPAGALLPSPNVAPTCVGAPTSLSYSGNGPHTFSIAPYCSDANDDVMTYSLTETRSGITINASTGVITITSAAVSTTGNVTIQVSDGLLAVTHTVYIAVASTPAAPGKWNPGHYFLVNTYGADALLSKRITYYDTLAAESCVTGVVVRLKSWGLLESTLGDYQIGYDFLDAEIAALSARGLKMILMLGPDEFSAQPFTPSTTLVPDYIKGVTYATAGGYVGNAGGLVAGPTAWYGNLRHPPVADRWIALIQALGARYDGNATVEAVICTGESAIPVNATYPRPDNMTDNQFRDATLTQWKRIGRAARAAFPNTLVTVMANYITDRLDDLLADAETYRYGAGGPDLYPSPYVYPGGSLHSLPAATRIYMGTEGGNISPKDYRGILFYSDQNQSPVYSGKEGAYLPEEIRQHMVNVQQQSHCIWVRMWTPTNQTYFNRSDMTWAAYQAACEWQTGILSILRANPGTVTTVPTKAF